MPFHFWKIALERNRNCCFWRPALPEMQGAVPFFLDMGVRHISGIADFFFIKKKSESCRKNAKWFCQILKTKRESADYQKEQDRDYNKKIPVKCAGAVPGKRRIP